MGYTKEKAYVELGRRFRWSRLHSSFVWGLNDELLEVVVKVTQLLYAGFGGETLDLGGYGATGVELEPTGYHFGQLENLPDSQVRSKLRGVIVVVNPLTLDVDSMSHGMERLKLARSLREEGHLVVRAEDVVDDWDGFKLICFWYLVGHEAPNMRRKIMNSPELPEINRDALIVDTESMTSEDQQTLETFGYLASDRETRRWDRLPQWVADRIKKPI